MSPGTPKSAPGLSYRSAGVDIDAGHALVERIKPEAKRTARPGLLSGLGGFGAFFELPAHYRQPVLVSTTDGVGTKLKLGIETGRHRGLGIDLVAMCVNVLIVAGAEPLFFLDYYASGTLAVEVAAEVIAGIADGCVQAGCALVGGETAEMPGLYTAGDYDLAGFAVGAVEKSRLIDGRAVQAGDAVLGLASSGAHSNGYSLIRKVLAQCEDHNQRLDGVPLMEHLLAPTRIYVKPLLALCAALEVHACAHITGGGLVENPPRVLPPGLGITLDTAAWPRPAVFTWIAENGPVMHAEMLRTFNCGLGMLVILAESAVAPALALLAAQGEAAYCVGKVEHRLPDAPVMCFNGPYAP